MNTGITPLGARVVIKRLEAAGTTMGGIVLPDQARETSMIAAVIAVGPGTKSEKMEVAAGDEVIVAKYAGTEIDIDGQELSVITQKDILAVVSSASEAYAEP